VTRQRVAQVVGILYGAAGREVTHEVIDAWAVALANTPEGDDALEVAAELARGSDFPTLAQFSAALFASRRRHALEVAQARALSEASEVGSPPSDPANRAAYVNGCRREAARLGLAAPAYPDAPTERGSMSRLLRDMFRPPPEPIDSAECWYWGDDPAREENRW
jgi:hypothetical protein